jgi:nucleotide-binding universal stress UspA family protein
MFRHLLVPLDGSRLAESAIVSAASLAALMGSAVTLVHVIEKNAPSAVHSDRHLVTAGEAAAYLEEVARAPILSGLKVGTHVHTAEVRDVARSITEHTEELAPDLVVMSTHGRGGARRLIFGDIAQQIIAIGETPVLLVRPSETAAAAARTGPACSFEMILAPINGDPAHEKGLPAAADIAKACGARVHLLMVVPTLGNLSGSKAAAGLLLPGATRVLLDMDSAGASDYVESRAADLARIGVTVTSESTRGDPVRSILRAIQRLGVDLVVMGTHGRAGTDAFWAGSVAARVIDRTSVPILLVPLGDET